uniref:Chromosome 1 open reading frame 141 n=1 Tax=Sciurus vulgaris TaxID=55149 RepID=A0A8D2D033_SCIVU
MAERVLRKLELLDKQAKILMKRRAKKNKLQYERKGKTIPLTFDYHSEFEEGSAKTALKTVSKIMEDKSRDTRKSKKYVSLKREPEPRKRDFEKPNLRPQFVPTNIKNQESKSKAQMETNTRKSLESIGFLEDDINKRRTSPPPLNDFSTKEKKSITNEDSVRKNSLLPLCFEDELKNPNAKIINISPAKTETSQMEQKDTKPIIFHDTNYIQMLLLTKNGLSPHLSENENIYSQKRTSFVLERNCSMLKSSIGDHLLTFSEPRRSMFTAWEKDKQATPLKVDHRTVKDSSDQPSKDRPWSTSYTISPTFSRFTKKCVGYLDKTVIGEKSDKARKFERMLSTVKPMLTHKFSASPVKGYSKPLKNILEVHKLSDLTPLDDLLNLSKDLKVPK